MRLKTHRWIGLAVLLFGGLALLVGGCFGGGNDKTGNTTPVTTGHFSTTSTVGADGEQVLENEELSTFRSKDPFIQQAQGGGTTPPTSETSSSTSTTRPTTPSGSTITTIFRPTSTTRPPTSSTTPGGSSTTSPPPTSTTSTTAPHLHTLRVLSAAQVGGAAAVTLQVDSSVYKDRRIGDVVSTSWGQIKILDVNTSSGVVTLLHGSETLNLVVGQAIYE